MQKISNLSIYRRERVRGDSQIIANMFSNTNGVLGRLVIKIRINEKYDDIWIKYVPLGILKERNHELISRIDIEIRNKVMRDAIIERILQDQLCNCMNKHEHTIALVFDTEMSETSQINVKVPINITNEIICKFLKKGWLGVRIEPGTKEKKRMYEKEIDLEEERFCNFLREFAKL